MYKKFQPITQSVGVVTLALLAFYGLAALLFGGGNALAASLDNILAAPAIPATFNYQGTLRDPGGNLVTGAYTITAKIYNLASGGSVLYQETFPNVTVRDGMFNIVLGDNPQGQDLLAQFSETPRYIGITLVGQGDELIPRQRLHGVPWALYATNASQADDFTVNGTLDVYGEDIAITEAGSGDTLKMGTWGAALDITFNKDLWLYGIPDDTHNIYLLSKKVGIGTTNPTARLDVNGDIHWSGGHLTGFTLTDDYSIVSDAWGNQSVTMVSSANSMCFLTQVFFKKNEGADEDAVCEITNDGTNWILWAKANGNLTNDAYASCKARCIGW